LAGAALLFAAALASGCGSETGVLIEVTRDSATTPEDIEKLEFVIGLSSEANPDVFLKDGASISEVGVAGRDLVTRPYDLLVHPGPRGDAQVTVAVIAYRGTEVVGFAGFGKPQPFIGGQVLERHITLINDPSALVAPSGCVIWIDAEDQRHTIGTAEDQDCDGDPAATDCNDLDPEVGHNHAEVCGNGIDDNCVMGIDEVIDGDGDGIENCNGDCNDADPEIHPGALEICDGKDNDCSGFCDDGLALDSDGDRFNECGGKILEDGTCKDLGVPDCDDSDPTVHPEAIEVCNGKNDDCKDGCDVADGIDRDGDQFTECGTVPGTDCIGPLDQLRDCNDDDPGVHPGAEEVCDGKDDDCDGNREQHEPCYGDASGSCRVGARTCDDDGSDGFFGLTSECLTTDTTTVNQGLCSAYDACEVTYPDTPPPPPPTLFECANAAQANTSQKFSCTLWFKPDLSLCPGTRVPLDLPITQGSSCSYRLLGGMIQSHYTVGLFDGSGGGAQASLSDCTVEFGIIAKRDFLPRSDAVYVEYADDANAARAYEIAITPMLVALCPQNGLECN
jgi:Putative metal-binding motif